MESPVAKKATDPLFTDRAAELIAVLRRKTVAEVAGLMSLEPFETVRDRLVTLRAAARGLGVTLEEPFLQLAFLCLPVIPHLKITDMGLVDVDRFEIIG